jgi:hypothetical protein
MLQIHHHAIHGRGAMIRSHPPVPRVTGPMPSPPHAPTRPGDGVLTVGPSVPRPDGHRRQLEMLAPCTEAPLDPAQHRRLRAEDVRAIPLTPAPRAARAVDHGGIFEQESTSPSRQIEEPPHSGSEVHARHDRPAALLEEPQRAGTLRGL